MFYSIQQIIPDILNTDKNWRNTLLKNWSFIIGQLNCHMRLEKICDNTLIIGVYEPQWMQELFLLSKVIIDQINTNLGHKYITNLKFKLVEKITPNTKNTLNITNSSINKISKKENVLNLHQQNALSKIEDEQLKESLYNFFLNCSINN